MLSSPQLRADLRNHCVPILDHFGDPDDPSILYIVMPFLRFFDSPPFHTVEDCVDFIDQLLEVCPPFYTLRAENFCLIHYRASFFSTKLELLTGACHLNRMYTCAVG